MDERWQERKAVDPTELSRRALRQRAAVRPDAQLDQRDVRRRDDADARQVTPPVVRLRKPDRDQLRRRIGKTDGRGDRRYAAAARDAPRYDQRHDGERKQRSAGQLPEKLTTLPSESMT
jgi:hypothetical protein